MKPLEWWEHVQINIIESLGLREEAAHFRQHPDDWRAFREKLRETREGRS